MGWACREIALSQRLAKLMWTSTLFEQRGGRERDSTVGRSSGNARDLNMKDERELIRRNFL